MSTFSKVLLATDFSPQSGRLAECLFSICPDTETEVVLAHVLEGDDDADPDGSRLKKVQQRLEALQKELEQSGYEHVSVAVPRGEIHEAILGESEAERAELLLVASHGKGFFRRTLLGSTTCDLARAADRPLLISKLGDEGVDLLSKVMLPTDFSKKSLEALNVIRALREYVGEIIFLHVIERSRSKQDYKQMSANAHMFLKELVDEMKIFGIEADYRVCRGVASKKIGELCEKEQISLLMMSKNGSAIKDGMGIGSTTENVVLNVDCSTLILPAEEVGEEEQFAD